MRALLLVLPLFAVLAACSTDDSTTERDSPDAASPVDGGALDGTLPHDGSPASTPDAADGATSASDSATNGDGTTSTDSAVSLDGATDASPGLDASDAAACTTTITYGGQWIAGAGRTTNYDVTSGLVTWDGACTDDGANSHATLSNGWKPYFTGHGGCAMALDATGCTGAPTACATRITYGSAWLAPANHASLYDDVSGAVLWDGVCTTGSNSVATLSNGWTPNFSGAGTCELSLRWTQCGGLYDNPVIPVSCPDPGVLHDGARYVLSCTSGDAANAFPIRTSPDLIHWTDAGNIFPSASKPAWAASDFWAPEIHAVGAGYVAYFSARHTDGLLSIGAATASNATGPFTDVGHPIVHQTGPDGGATGGMGAIDASEIQATDGTLYLLWKDDGNALGKPTPIHAQALAADGVTLTGSPVTLITNDQPWEGAVTEGPWMIAHAGEYFLFYSGNSYANASYALGVARASSPLGPFTKASAPIVVTKGNWVGPGHCSVVDAPSGDLAVVYHAWITGHVNGSGDARVALVDRLDWGTDGWPHAIAPSSWAVAVP